MSAYGIRIHDAEIEVGPETLDALLKTRSGELTLTKIDLSITPEALNRLLKSLSPRGTLPSARVSSGRLQLTAQQQGKKAGIDLQLGTVRIELSPEGVRLVSGE